MPETTDSDRADAISPAPLIGTLADLIHGFCTDTDNAAALVTEAA
jgi:hypothetical protein